MPRKKKHLVEPRKPLDAAQQALVERYVPLARALSKPLKKCWRHAWDELESTALFALVDAASTFNPDRRVRFPTYARVRILGALRDLHRRLTIEKVRSMGNKRGGPVRFGSAPIDSTEPLNVLNIPDGHSPAHEVESAEEVESWLRQIPDKHATLCRLMYLDGVSQHQAAQLMGCSQSRLSAMHREAMAMLNGSWYGQTVLATDDGDPDS